MAMSEVPLFNEIVRGQTLSSGTRTLA